MLSLVKSDTSTKRSEDETNETTAQPQFFVFPSRFSHFLQNMGFCKLLGFGELKPGV